MLDSIPVKAGIIFVLSVCSTDNSSFSFFFQAEDGIRYLTVTGVQTCALPICYYVTNDDLVIMASEVGVLDVPPENILIKERLHPGRIFLVDTARGCIVQDEEIKRELAAAQPYGEWLAHLVDIEDLPPPPHLPLPSHETVRRRQQLFGYTNEDLRVQL